MRLNNPYLVAARTIVATALAVLALGACGSSDETASTATSSPSDATTTSAAAATSSAHAAKPNVTLADYLRDNGIAETSIHHGDPGAPTIDLPMPPDWRPGGRAVPDFAYGGIIYDNPVSPRDPSSIFAMVSKLTGDIDPAKILEFAPGELRNLPGYKGGDGTPTTLDGFDAVQLAGTYVEDGAQRFTAQKTVVIPGQDALFVLQLNANGPANEKGVMIQAMGVIDTQTTITPPAAG